MKTPATMRCGRNPTVNVLTRSAFFASEYASQMTSATFAISAGWMCTGPTESHRAAPPPECPKPTTQRRSSTPTRKRTGYVSR
jgi:hypothetical protein